MVLEPEAAVSGALFKKAALIDDCGAENHHFSKLFGCSFLGWLLEPMLVIFGDFWGPFWRQF